MYHARVQSFKLHLKSPIYGPKETMINNLMLGFQHSTHIINEKLIIQAVVLYALFDG